MELRQILEEEFSGDALLKEVKIHNLENELFTDEILNMDVTTTYSTPDAARIIGRNDSTVRNYFRSDLIDYIEPEKLGKHYRLNYRSIFKLKMILLLVEKANKTIADLAYYCGIVALKSESNYGNSLNNRRNTINESNITTNSDLQEEIDKLKKMMVVHTLKWNVYEEEKKLGLLTDELKEIDHQIELSHKDIELLKIKKRQQQSENKYYKMLDHSLRKTVAGTKEEKRGLLSILFGGSQKEHVDIDSVLKEAAQISQNESEKTSEFDEHIASIEGIIKEKEEKRQELVQKIEVQNNKIKQLSVDNDLERLTFNESDISNSE